MFHLSDTSNLVPKDTYTLNKLILLQCPSTDVRLVEDILDISEELAEKVSLDQPPTSCRHL